MSRPLRIEFPGGSYHLTPRGDGRDDIYLTDGDRALFGASL
jgi:putative transposase